MMASGKKQTERRMALLMGVRMVVKLGMQLVGMLADGLVG
jgi:hypothetical protein